MLRRQKTGLHLLLQLGLFRIHGTRMTGTDLRRRRLALNWTPEKLGELLGESGDRITGWEELDGPLPPQFTRRAEWTLAAGEREQAMEACPVPPCEVAERIGAALDPAKPAAMERVLAELEAHGATCPTCQARKAYADRLPPLPPFPMPGGMRAVVAVAEQVRRLPAWLRPAAAGALIMGAMTLFKALLTILLQRRVTPQLLLAVAAAIGIGAYGGAVGGLAYSVVRPRTRPLGRLGDALTGVACAWACVLAIAIPYSLITGDAALREPVTIIAILGVATAVGVAFGRSAFRADEEDATAS